MLCVAPVASTMTSSVSRRGRPRLLMSITGSVARRECRTQYTSVVTPAPRRVNGITPNQPISGPRLM